MALNDIIFIKGQGGLGRPLEGEDYISGLAIYSDGALPSGFSLNQIQAVGSLQDAENLGVTIDYSDATAAVGVFFVDAIGTNGDTANIKVTAIDTLGQAATYDLGTYTKTASETTAAAIAAAITIIINNGTVYHGFSCVQDGVGLIITAPKRLGTAINGTGFTLTQTSAILEQDTTFAGGTFSYNAVFHYHISEFFRMQPRGYLYVGLFATGVTHDFVEIQTMQDVSNGKLRQIGVFRFEESFTLGDLAVIQGICNTVSNEHKPLSALYAANYGGDLSALPDLSAQTANNVSVVIGQDKGGQGNYLYITTGSSITCLGATLGAVAFSKVSEDIAWVGKYNISNGAECDTVGFANGVSLVNASQGLLNILDNRRYIFLIKYVGIAGSYFNDSHCAVAVTSDYAYIENNRTIDKAIRGVYSSMLPNLNSPLVLNADGTLTDTTIAYFKSQARVNLDQMIRDVELSAFAVDIDTTQNVLSTSNLIISVKLVPIGVARQITVNIGFTLSI